MVKADSEEWNFFKLQYETVRIPEEELKRLKNFKENLKFIENHNENGTSNFNLRVNHLVVLEDDDVNLPGELESRLRKKEKFILDWGLFIKNVCVFWNFGPLEID